MKRRFVVVEVRAGAGVFPAAARSGARGGVFAVVARSGAGGGVFAVAARSGAGGAVAVVARGGAGRERRAGIAGQVEAPAPRLREGCP